VLFYRLVRALFRIIALPMFRLRVFGAGRIPAEGAAVIVAIHRSWLDPACVGAACRRPVRFLMLDQVYQRAGTRWFYRAMRAIPVRPGGKASLPALRAALRALESGQVVCVFPEGRVLPEGDVGKVHPGAALLAARTGAPIVPMFIRGSARAWPHGRRLIRPTAVSVAVGPPVDPHVEGESPTVEVLVGRIEGALRALGAGEARP
jgi:1-acyl-sn-glycerol-3-phosphate acyltransferase